MIKNIRKQKKWKTYTPQPRKKSVNTSKSQKNRILESTDMEFKGTLTERIHNVSKNMP